jgi:hypothetical protein
VILQNSIYKQAFTPPKHFQLISYLKIKLFKTTNLLFNWYFSHLIKCFLLIKNRQNSFTSIICITCITMKCKANSYGKNKSKVNTRNMHHERQSCLCIISTTTVNTTFNYKIKKQIINKWISAIEQNQTKDWGKK